MLDDADGGYNALVSAALERAQQHGKPMYVFVTAANWVVSPAPPPFDRLHLRCEPDPALVLGCRRDAERGHWIEQVLWPRELVALPVPTPDAAPA